MLQKLPPEILYVISEFLDDQTKINLRKVCKSIYFMEIKFKLYKPLRYQMSNFFDITNLIMDEFHATGVMRSVKQLEITDFYCDIKVMLEYFPNLEKIEVSRNYEYDMDFTHNKKLKSIVYESSRKTNFPNVNNLSLYRYPHEIDFSLLNNLTSLEINPLGRKIDFSLLPNLTWLKMSYTRYTHKIEFEHLKNLKYLYMVYVEYIDLRPLNNLIEFEIYTGYGTEIDFSNSYKLEILKLGDCFDKVINFNYLINLKYLSFGELYISDLDLSPLVNLETFIMPYHYERPLYFKNLKKLIHIELPCWYNHFTDFSDQINLKYIKFGYGYNRKTILDNCLNLEEIVFDVKYRQNDDFSKLKKLKIIRVNYRFFNTPKFPSTPIVTYNNFEKIFNF